jgi:drug/metabolite transporter (DMT)-like permease
MIGSAVLGVLCSWLGSFLWNRACLHLPVSLAGQLTIFETLFGISFVYIFEQRFPPTMEFLGICFLLTAILYGIRASSQAAQEKELAESANLLI